MISAFTKALSQMFSGGFQWVLVKTLAMTIALLALGWWGLTTVLERYVVFPWHWLETVVDYVLSFGVIIGMMFLIGPVAALIGGFYLDRIAEQVERRHYPDDPPGQDPPLIGSALTAVKFSVVLVLVNVAVLVLTFLPGPNLIVFLIGNGYLLGREFFELVAARFMAPRDVRFLRRANGGRIFLAGLVIAAAAMIPFVNLLIPLFATAFMVHIFKGITRKAGGRPPKVRMRAQV